MKIKEILKKNNIASSSFYSILYKDGRYELLMHITTSVGTVDKVDYSVRVKDGKFMEQTFRGSNIDEAIEHFNQITILNL